MVTITVEMDLMNATVLKRSVEKTSSVAQTHQGTVFRRPTNAMELKTAAMEKTKKTVDTRNCVSKAYQSNGIEGYSNRGDEENC